MIKSGISVFGSRTARAIAHVAHAGLIRRPKRAVNQITKRDLEVLQEHPDRVDSQMSSANLGPARELLKGVPYLRGRRAVITMSRFSPDAYSYAEKVAARVILIDGATLASLLVKHDIGAQNSETFVLKPNRAGQLVIPSALGALQRASAPRACFGPLPQRSRQQPSLRADSPDIPPGPTY